MNAATIFGRTFPSAAADVYGAFNGTSIFFLHFDRLLMSSTQWQYLWLQSLEDCCSPCLVLGRQQPCLYLPQFMDFSLGRVSFSSCSSSQANYWLLDLVSRFTACSLDGRFFKVSRGGRVNCISCHCCVRQIKNWRWTDQGLALPCLWFLLPYLPDTPSLEHFFVLRSTCGLMPSYLEEYIFRCC